MKRSTAGLLPVMFPVRRRYQQRARQKENASPPVLSPVRRREKNRK
jgi:hypothetical protein